MKIRKARSTSLETVEPEIVPDLKTLGFFDFDFKDIADVHGAKNEMAKLIYYYNKGELSGEKARVLAFLFQQYIGFLRLEAEMRIEERLERIEAALIERIGHVGD